MCIKALAAVPKYPNKMENVESLITMKGPCDPTYVCASSKLEVVYSDEMGRHVCAKEDINVGEVLVIEDPYFTLLLKSQYLLCCSYCLLSNLNLLPCNNCCFAMYCSEECRVKALKEYHSVECDLMATLFKMDFTQLELSALRTVIKARYDHADWKSLFETIKEADANMNTKYQGQVKVGDKWLYDSKYYTSIHTLATNVEKRSISDIFQKAVSAAVFLRFLKLNTTFLQSDNIEEQDKIFKCVAGLLLLHLMTVPTNMHGISTNVMNENGILLSDISVASGAYAFLSLINHSCAPNVVRFNKEGEGIMTLFALRPIKKGMQIFDNYGSHYDMEDYNSRQSSLKFQYKFTCVCEACVDKWPMYVQLNMMSSKNLPVKICQRKRNVLNKHVIRQLQSGDVGTALTIYKDLCILCEQLDKYAPCAELCECQEALKQCFMIFEGFRTFGSDDIIEWKEITSKTFNGRHGCTILPGNEINQAVDVELCAEWGVLSTCTKVQLLPPIQLSQTQISLLNPPSMFIINGHPNALKAVKITPSPGLKVETNSKEGQISVTVKSETTTCGVGWVNVVSKLTSQEIRVEVERECEIACGTLLGALFSIMKPYLSTLVTVAFIAGGYIYVQSHQQQKGHIQLPNRSHRCQSLVPRSPYETLTLVTRACCQIASTRIHSRLL
ncbi:unnamed protein product [Danaus chrysippus]|uniref:Protein-lysine N-methyltransferase SMYD4 n=1 Tax=Danaus chrysippus TaxID=151541 RepID=A0A8J2VTL0_9NEOP|nr:unnamed protein product [Danaus chrysippus]